MADNKMNQSNNPNQDKQNQDKQNESMQRDQGQKTGERKPEQGGFDKNRQNEQGRDKSAIGGGQSGQSSQSEMGQKSGQSSTGQNKEFDKNRNEPTNR